MRNRTRLSAACLLILVLGAGACQKSITHPTHRQPVITSMVAFPTALGPGDSTLVTVFATDPDGDSLVYDWEGFNGLIPKDAYPGYTDVYSSHSASMVFYRSPDWTYPTDTAFVWCSARDNMGGSASRHVLIFYKH